MAIPDELDPDAFAARLAASIREKLTPEPLVPVLDWENGFARPQIPDDVDGYYIEATGKFLPKGAEPDFPDRSTPEKYISYNFGQLFQGVSGGYTWDGKAWTILSNATNIRIPADPNFGQSGSTFHYDNYGNFVVGLPHTKVYVVRSLAPLHPKLYSELCRGVGSNIGVNLSSVEGIIPAHEFVKSFAPAASTAGLPSVLFVDPKIVAIQKGRRHVQERSVDERELFVRICAHLCNQVKQSMNTREKFYMGIQQSLTCMPGNASRPVDAGADLALVNHDQRCETRRAQLAALAARGAGARATKLAIFDLRESFAREQAARETIAELRTQLDEAREQQTVAFAEQFEALKVAIEDRLPKSAKAELQTLRDAVAASDQKMKNMQTRIEKGDAYEAEKAEHLIAASVARAEDAEKRVEALKHRIAELRSEVASATQAAAMAEMEKARVIAETSAITERASEQLKNEECHNARLQEKIVQLTKELEGKPDGDIMGDLVAEADRYRKEASTAINRADELQKSLSSLQALLRTAVNQ